MNEKRHKKMKSVKDQLNRPPHSPRLPSVDSDAVRLKVNENVREKVAGSTKGGIDAELSKLDPRRKTPDESDSKERNRRNVLVVCTGNTCRSPMAEAIIRSLFANTTHVESAGIEAADGLPPTKEAVAVMKELGLDIGEHRSRDIENVDLHAFQVIIVMTTTIKERLIERGTKPERIVGLEIQDPYCKGIEAYRATANELKNALGSLFELDQPDD